MRHFNFSERANFPGLRIVGEEGDLKDVSGLPAKAPNLNLLDSCDKDVLVPKNDICVWVDPLDGTKMFAKGKYEAVSVLIGVCFKGHPVLGIIHQPYAESETDGEGRGVVYWGGKAFGGVWRYGQNSFPYIETNADFSKISKAVCMSASRSQGVITDCFLELQKKGVVQGRLERSGAGTKCAVVMEGKEAGQHIIPTFLSKLSADNASYRCRHLVVPCPRWDFEVGHCCWPSAY